MKEIIFIFIWCLMFLFISVYSWIVFKMQSVVEFQDALAKSEFGSIALHEEVFGEPMYVSEFHNIRNALASDFHFVKADSRFSNSKKVYVFPLKTIPRRFLVVGFDEDGAFEARTWIYM